MAHLQSFHDWLLKTVSGILLIGVVGSMLAAGFLKGSTWCVRKAMVVLPPRLRHLNRKKTQRAIARLEKLNGNTEAIILEVIFSLAYCAVGVACLAVFFALHTLLVHPSIPSPPSHLAIHTNDDAVMLTTQIVLGSAFLAGYFGIAMFNLYYRLSNYDRVVARLKSHLAEFDLGR